MHKTTQFIGALYAFGGQDVAGNKIDTVEKYQDGIGWSVLPARMCRADAYFAYVLINV